MRGGPGLAGGSGAYRVRRLVWLVLLYLALTAGAALMLLPFAWMLSTSLKTLSEALRIPPIWIPKVPRWENYALAWNAAPFGRYFFNSFFIAITTTVGEVITTILAAYGFAKMNFQIEAAVRLVEFLLRPENTVYWAKETGYLPVTVSGFESDEWQDFIAANPERAAMTEQFLEGGFGQLHHPAYWDIRSVIITYYEQVLLGESDPKTALDNLAAEIEALISE